MYITLYSATALDVNTVNTTRFSMQAYCVYTEVLISYIKHLAKFVPLLSLPLTGNVGYMQLCTRLSVSVTKIL